MLAPTIDGRHKRLPNLAWRKSVGAVELSGEKKRVVDAGG